MAAHPRLFFPKGEEAAVLEKAAGNPLLAQLIEVLRKEADKALTLPPQVYESNKELLAISREEVRRIVTLSMAWRLFGKEEYARKAEEELLNVSNFASWNPKHFLDVAEMTTAVAIGYDWCYDQLQPATRHALENAIRKKALQPAWPLYTDAERGKSTPVSRENNWNMVCNSGLVTGVLAIADQYPSEAREVIENAVRYTPNLLKSFAPEGVYNEGPGYWAFNAMYMALFFDNLQRNVGNDFGLPLYPGINNTASFYTNLVGSSGLTFNFGDAGTREDNSEAFFFLSRQYHRPEVAASYRTLLKSLLDKYESGENVELSRFLFLTIPWFDNTVPDKEQADRPLEVFQGVTDFLFFNGDSRSNPGRLYLAAKTGRPDWSHNHLDVGSFVLDYEGLRWAMDPGADSYGQTGFWDYGEGGQRWHYFRNTNLAHNTLNIDGKTTRSDGQGELVRYDHDVPHPFGILDISPGYAGQATSVVRGFRLLGPSTVLVQDELMPDKAASLVSWRMLTAAQVSISGNTATLTQKGKSFFIKCLLDKGYTMTVRPAAPNTASEKPVEGISIIEITVPATGKPLTIPVLMTGDLSAIPATEYTSEPLNSWK